MKDSTKTIARTFSIGFSRWILNKHMSSSRLQGGSEFAEGHLPSHVSSLPEVKTDSFFFCIYPWEKIKLEIDGKPLMSGLRGWTIAPKLGPHIRPNMVENG